MGYNGDLSGNYDGNFKDGKRHGPCTITFPDDVKYTGSYENGDEIGEFTFSFPDGEIIKGRWAENPTLVYAGLTSEIIEDEE